MLLDVDGGRVPGLEAAEDLQRRHRGQLLVGERHPLGRQRQRRRVVEVKPEFSLVTDQNQGSEHVQDVLVHLIISHLQKKAG